MDPLRSRYPRYYAHRDFMSAAERVVSGYRRTVDGGTPVGLTHSHRDSGLPEDTVRVSTPDDSIVYTALVWAGRDDDLEEHLRRWLLGRIHLEGTKRGHGRRPDPWWVRVWQKANPGRT